MEETYKKILNMTNKEAAAIIKDCLVHPIVGRANGKSIMAVAFNQALIKAVEALENTPD